MESDTQDTRKWYAIQTRSNMEKKAVETLKHMIDVEDMGAYISKEDILMPEEKVSEIKDGKKTTRLRKLYPGYFFVRVKLYDEDENFLEKPWYFIRGINGVINFMGGERPVALRKAEIERIQAQMAQAEGVERPKINFNVGEAVKIHEGPFLGLTGIIEEVDTERGKLKVSVSIFGRFTPVELEYSQVTKAEEAD
ncbi:MAG: transcription termination/antitermination factor NusG [Opitutales bacterium]|nr:transcription termination/antitermination factor NusG [Opitutales bacterium]MBR7106713.1 transcription termination/antitermination factor NusG [Opitutales bacterium]